MKKVFISDDSVTGVCSAIYDAWGYRNSPDGAGVVLEGKYFPELFREYEYTEISIQKEQAVRNLIRRHIDPETQIALEYVLLSNAEDRGDVVFQVLLLAREKQGSGALIHQIIRPSVARAFEISRKVSNEAHFYKEIIRFRELDNGVMFSEITPENRIATCFADHFANRFCLEDFLIWDQTHNVAIVHPKSKSWSQIYLEEGELEQMGVSDSKLEGDMQELWQCFFDSVAIQERVNRRCQMNHLPLKYRNKMVEFRRSDK